MDELVKLLEVDARFIEASFVAEANTLDVVTVLAETDPLHRAARIARARVIAAEQRKALKK